jgi:hypothetical protein
MLNNIITVAVCVASRFSAYSRNGGSVNNTSGTWLSTAERRSLRRPSPTANGAVNKETLIPEEMTTNVDSTELLDGGSSSKKMMPVLGNPALRIGFVHQEDVGLMSGFPVVATASSAAGALVGQQQQQQPCSPEGGVLYHRPAKPVEWRVHLASVKVRFPPYYIIALSIIKSLATLSMRNLKFC